MTSVGNTLYELALKTEVLRVVNPASRKQIAVQDTTGLRIVAGCKQNDE
jgi:hypothetical protein